MTNTTPLIKLNLPIPPVYIIVTFIYLSTFPLLPMVAVNIAVQANFAQEESLVDKVKTAILDFVRPERPERMLPTYELKHEYLKAAECAVKMRDYSRAFRNYDRANDHFAFIEGMYLAQSIQDNHKALEYALKAKDYVNAGFLQARLGKTDEAMQTWRNIWEAA